MAPKNAENVIVDPFTFTRVNLDGHGPGTNLSGRVAAVLTQKIQDGGLRPGARLPTEHVMAQRFGVSRTVIREAIAALKAEGVVETRQGSGVFVQAPGSKSAFNIDATTSESTKQIVLMIEVRRAIDSETAAIAALRADKEQIADIRRALQAIDDAVAAGGDGVHEDVHFHMSIARATGNPYWVKLMEMFAPQLRAAVSITRANEARRHDFSTAARLEHHRLLDAIASGDAEEARAAAAGHMDGASDRVSSADPEFWSKDGKPRFPHAD